MGQSNHMSKHHHFSLFQTGMFVLYTVSSSAAEQLKPHLASLLQLLGEVINDNQNQLVPYYAVK